MAGDQRRSQRDGRHIQLVHRLQAEAQDAQHRRRVEQQVSVHQTERVAPVVQQGGVHPHRELPGQQAGLQPLDAGQVDAQVVGAGQVAQPQGQAGERGDGEDRHGAVPRLYTAQGEGNPPCCHQQCPVRQQEQHQGRQKADIGKGMGGNQLHAGDIHDLVFPTVGEELQLGGLALVGHPKAEHGAGVAGRQRGGVIPGAGHDLVQKIHRAGAAVVDIGHRDLVAARRNIDPAGGGKQAGEILNAGAPVVVGTLLGVGDDQVGGHVDGRPGGKIPREPYQQKGRLGQK